MISQRTPKGNFSFGNKESLQDDSYYPTHYEILIEHENSIDSCWQEMVKLVHFKAKLKVLITYNSSIFGPTFDVEEKEKVDSVKQNFSDTIRQANTSIKENENTEYVLIIGQRRVHENQSFIK